MAKKARSQQINVGQAPSGLWKVGRASLSASNSDDPQTLKLARSFIKSPQRFLECVQDLRGKIQSQLEWSSGGWKWNPPEPFNYATFAGDAGRCCDAFHAARYENSKLTAFDGEVFRSLVRLFDQMAMEPNVPVDLIGNFQRFIDEVDRLKLLLSVSGVAVSSDDELPLGLLRCDVPNWLKRQGHEGLVKIPEAYSAVMEALMAAAPHAVSGTKKNHLKENGSDTKNAPTKLRDIIAAIGLTIDNWTLKELEKQGYQK